MRIKIGFLDGRPAEELPTWAAGVEIFASENSGYREVKRITQVSFMSDIKGQYLFVCADPADGEKAPVLPPYIEVAPGLPKDELPF